MGESVGLVDVAMRSKMIAFLAGAGVDLRKLRRGIVTFIAVEAEAGDEVAIGEGADECGHAIRGGFIAQQAENEASGDAVFLGSELKAAVVAGDLDEVNDSGGRPE